VDWGIIPDDQKDGGKNTFLKAGLVYDTRDNEPNPMSGIWTEAFILGGIPVTGVKKYTFSKVILTHRQYFTLYPKVLNLAYRVSYQSKISGTMPFFMLPYIYNSSITRDGLGGAKTIRGVMRNRIAGEDYFYGNVELRWKFYQRVIMNQNFYAALVGFYDTGIVTSKYKFKTNAEAQSYLNMGEKESWHSGYGGGLYFAMNQNFVVSFVYGIAAEKADGTNGLYIGLNFLY
jgi:hemolysin activation/secretion protein